MFLRGSLKTPDGFQMWQVILSWSIPTETDLEPISIDTGPGAKEGE